MNKILYMILITSYGFGISACVDDKGNYDYKPKEEIAPGEITGVEEYYEVVSLKHLVIEPSIGGNEADYDFIWYAYSATVNTDQKDTLGFEKNLDYVMALPTDTYRVILEARHKKYGTASYRQTEVVVTSEFTQGWYVTKTLDGCTDVDRVSFDGMVQENILKTINGKSLEGEAIKSSFIFNYYNHEQVKPDGTTEILKDKSAFFVISKSDIGIYNGEDMTLFKDQDNAFLEKPVKIAPQNIIPSHTGNYILNNGKAHWMFLGTGVGKFGWPIVGENYALADDVFWSSVYGVMVYDTVSCSFKGLQAQQTRLIDLADTESKKVSCNQMNCRLLYMKEQDPYGGMATQAIALMKNKEKEEYYAFIMDMIFAYGLNPIKSVDTIPLDREVCYAKVYTVNNNDPVIYFSHGDHAVHMYNVTNRNETKEVVLCPESEKVTAIRHVTYVTGVPTYAVSDYFVVLSSEKKKWHMRCYRFVGNTPEVEKKPFLDVSGHGEAVHILYRNISSEAVI